MQWGDFQAVFLDLDGTLCRQRHPLPGAAETVEHLRRLGISVAIVTNNSAHTHGQILSRLEACGIPSPDVLHTSGDALAELALEIGRRRGRAARVFNFAGEGLAIALTGRAELVESAKEPCDAVAVASHTRENQVLFDFDRAITGLGLLRAGADLLVGCADRVFPIHDHPAGVEFGSGALAAMFAFGADLPPSRIRYAGKPEPAFYTSLCERMGVDPQRCLMVGDNLEADIAGAKGVGMRTLTVLSGVTKRSDAAAAQGDRAADLVCEDLQQALRVLGAGTK